LEQRQAATVADICHVIETADEMPSLAALAKREPQHVPVGRFYVASDELSSMACKLVLVVGFGPTLCRFYVLWILLLA